MADTDLRYPIGKFQRPAAATSEDRAAWIATFAAAPARFRDAVRNLNDAQLDTPYRPDGWTVRQVIHHVADSHMNSYIRFRLALTETDPTIKPYEEAQWAALHDARSLPVEVSLQLLESLHLRLVELLRSLAPSDFDRTFRHPVLGQMTLTANLALYAWHSRHHEAHVTALRNRMGW
jgi:DinB superfamily